MIHLVFAEVGEPHVDSFPRGAVRHLGRRDDLAAMADCRQGTRPHDRRVVETGHGVRWPRIHQSHPKPHLIAARPLFAAGDVIPAGALERFARRQEADLAASLDGFQVAGRHPVALGPHPGLRLAFQSTSGGAPTRTLQDYVLDRDRIVILTLAGPALAPEAELAAELDRLAAGLELAP